MAQTDLIIITGPPGIGKTTVAMGLAEQLPGVTARITGDAFILGVSPFEISDDRRLFLQRNLISFAQHASAHGYDRAIIDCVIPSRSFMIDMCTRANWSDKTLHVLALRAEPEAYRKRLTDRLGSDGVSEAGWQECLAWQTTIESIDSARIINTTNQTPEQTVSAVAAHLHAA